MRAIGINNLKVLRHFANDILLNDGKTCGHLTDWVLFRRLR